MPRQVGEGIVSPETVAPDQGAFVALIETHSLANMQRGVTMTTHFSGMDCPAHAVHGIENAFKKMRPDLGHVPGVTMLSACERDKRALQCLRALHKSPDFQKHASQHVFQDIEAMVTEQALSQAKDVVSRHATTKPAGKAASHEKAAAWDMVREVLEILLADDAFKPGCSCMVHQRTCGVFPGPSDGDEMFLEMAGTPCVDFSRRGKRQQVWGETCLPLCIWMAWFLKSGVPLACHECTVEFPDWLLEKPLQHFGSRAWRVLTFKVCPSNFGWPARRARRYSVLWNSAKVTFHGSYAGFVQTFFQVSELRGNIWFKDGEDLGMFCSKSRWEAFLMYRDEWLAKLQHGASSVSSCDVCDLNQKPPHGKLDSLVPTLVTHNSMYCFGRAKLLTHVECLKLQGIEEDSPVTQMARSGELSEAAARKLAGNGMHAISCGSMLMYIIANTSKRSQTEAFSRKPQSSRLFA